jgi:hypothetical protein
MLPALMSPPGSSQDRPFAPAFVAVRHIGAELLIQAKADPVQLGWLIALASSSIGCRTSSRWSPNAFARYR